MQDIASQVHKLLLKKKETISVAESCTGGLLSSLLTSLSGSSAYFMFGIVAYSNSAKKRLLGIPLTLINAKGAVSYEVAIKMAESARRLSRTDYGISVTGIAGPTGGTLQKPVGTVFIALSGKKKTLCRSFRFKGSRSSIRKQSVAKALSLLRKFLG